MSTNKRTPWFPAHVKPVHEGLYECQFCYGHTHYWNGRFWTSDDTPGSWRLAAGTFPWRGLAEKPA